jgi:hypothetical protein
LDLNQIDILGITQRLPEQQLMDRRAATEGDLSREFTGIEQITQRTANNEILFDLP